MSSKKWVLVFLVTVLVLAALLAGLNLAVDPFGALGDRLLSWFSYDETNNPRQDREQLDEVVDLIAETLCSRKKTIVIAGDEYPAEMVKEKLLRITASHIEYVFDCLKQNTTYVRNIKKYLLASLFNAPSTIGSYYSALVNHDMYGDGLRGR